MIISYNGRGFRINYKQIILIQLNIPNIILKIRIGNIKAYF